MRRFLILSAFLLVLATAPSAAALGFDLGLAAGAEFAGDVSNFDLDTDSGFSLGLELMFEVPVVKLGVGYEYGFPRDTDGVLSDMEYHMLYVVGRVNFFGPLYAVGRIGYADLTAELPEEVGKDSGNSFSLGAGIDLPSVKVEILYNDFDIEIDDFGRAVNYTNYQARVIYSF